MKKRFICIVLVLCLTLALAAPAGAVYVNNTYVAGQGLFILDYETGTELYGYNADTPFVPASITKLMSMYLTYEAIDNGEITLDTVVPISQKVYTLSRNTNYWNTVPLYYNQTYTVDELIELIFIYSASASVVAIAELICGDEAPFVERMNAKAAEWGIDATFNGCSGIEDNYITPRAVATLSSKLITDYPQVLEITSKKSIYFHGSTYYTTNHLLTSQPYEGTDGLKSGTTTNAGYCFVATAVRNGVRLITVVMKSANATSRYSDSITLLNYGFSVRDQLVRDATMRLEPYTDVYIDDWFADTVSQASSTGLMKGTSETTFSPNMELSRAMAVTLLHRVAGNSAPAEEGVFPDVDGSEWYADAANWAGSLGIVEGYEDGSFSGADPLTREELAVMLWRYAKISRVPPAESYELEGFSDLDTMSSWAAEALAWAVHYGIISGNGNGKLLPGSTANRAQGAAIFLRFMNYVLPSLTVPEPDEPDDSETPAESENPTEPENPDESSEDPAETAPVDPPAEPTPPDAPAEPENPAPEPTPEPTPTVAPAD